MMYEAIRDPTKLLERFVFIPRNLTKPAELKKDVGKSDKTFCVVPDLK